MKSPGRSVTCLFALVVVAACASTKVEDRQILVNEKVPRPDHIWVYDFASTPDQIPPESGFAGQLSGASPTAEQSALGRQVGADLAAQLAAAIREMGMPAEQAGPGTRPQINDLEIHGYLLSVNEGSAVERVAIGFGAGASELRVAVEGFQVTDRGLRKLGGGDVAAGGSKSPGAIVPAVVALASANPVGLIVSSGIKVYGEASGSSTVKGREEAVVKEIAEKIRPRFEQQGWIQ
jgi:Domain of unknown function (DUF4410)